MMKKKGMWGEYWGGGVLSPSICAVTMFCFLKDKR